MELGWAQRTFRDNKVRASLSFDAVLARVHPTHEQLMMRDVCGSLPEDTQCDINQWR